MLFYGGGREGCVQSAAYILQIWFFSLCKLLIYSKKPPGERSEGSFVGEKKGFLISFGLLTLTCSSYCLPCCLGVQCSTGYVRLCINNSPIKTDNILA